MVVHLAAGWRLPWLFHGAWTLDERLILLVEDHVLLRSMLVKMLMTLGYRVRAVASADEALALMSEGLTPRIVFTPPNGALDRASPGAAACRVSMRRYRHT